MREIEVINGNLRYALAAFARIGKAGAITPTRDINLVYAGVPYALFNTALLTTPVAAGSGDFHTAFDEATRFFESQQQAPWSMWFCEQFLTDADRRRVKLLLATRGMRSLMEAPAMITKGLGRPRRRLPELEIRPVHDQQSRLDFSDIMATAFHVPIEMAREVYAGESLWDGAFTGWIAYRDDQAVSTTCTIASEEAIGIYAVATRPRDQGKGYAESLMRYAIAQAQQNAGDLPVILQSSNSGYGLYVHLGFKNVGRYLVYISG